MVKITKRMLSGIFALLLLFVFTGCGSKAVPAVAPFTEGRSCKAKQATETKSCAQTVADNTDDSKCTMAADNSVDSKCATVADDTDECESASTKCKDDTSSTVSVANGKIASATTASPIRKGTANTTPSCRTASAQDKQPCQNAAGTKKVAASADTDPACKNDCRDAACESKCDPACSSSCNSPSSESSPSCNGNTYVITGANGKSSCSDILSKIYSYFGGQSNCGNTNSKAAVSSNSSCKGNTCSSSSQSSKSGVQGNGSKTTDSSEQTTSSAVGSDVYTKVLELVNAERAKAGLKPLRYCTEGQQAADLRAQEITKSFSHTRPDGRTCFTVWNDLGISGSYMCAENIAYGYQSAEKVMEGWMNSSGHRANILSENATALAVAKSGTSWVQVFAHDY